MKNILQKKKLYEKHTDKDERRRTSVTTSKVAAAFERNNIRKSTILFASVWNMACGSDCEADCSKSNENLKSVILLKSTVHRECRRLLIESEQHIHMEFNASNSVFRWDGNLLPD